MSERTCRIGVHGRNDTSFADDDYRVIAESRVEAVKMMSLTEPAVYRASRPSIPTSKSSRVCMMIASTTGIPPPPNSSKRWRRLCKRCSRTAAKFQVANEPNHVHRYEGWGAEDADAESFNAWFLDVYRLLKQACPWASIGFPGLAVPDFAHRDRAWLRICRPAIERADWLGVHCYWQTPTDRPSVMLDEQFGLTFKYYHSQYPDKTLEILECGNSNVHNPAWPISQDEIAREYVAWLQEVFRYPYINSVAFFLLSSPDRQNWDFFTWRTENNFVKPVAHAIGAMNRPPLVQSTPLPGPGTAARPRDHAGALRPQSHGPTRPLRPSATALRMDGQFTNNQIIDAFYDASVKLGLGDWTLLNRSGLSLEALVADRAGSYAGAASGTR